MTKEELFEKITLLNADSYNASMLERIHHRGASSKDANLPDPDDCYGDDQKPLSYPFDLAWEKSLMDKTSNCPPIVLEATESMKSISLQQQTQPIECETGFIGHI